MRLPWSDPIWYAHRCEEEALAAKSVEERELYTRWAEEWRQRAMHPKKARDDGE